MICDKKNCTGCCACFNICPKNAIIMKEDTMGYIYPEIDNNKCINCKMCEKVCPSINHVKTSKSKEAFVMWNKDNNIRTKSTSGGIATTLYKYVLEDDGIIYGCSNEIDNNIKFIRIDKADDLYKIQGSKYVHAYINDAYKNVKKDLVMQKKVMFIGTPCQIAGLKGYLQKEYDNLYVTDIICHGVPSQKILKDEIKTKIGNKNQIRVEFRENGQYYMKIFSRNKLLIREGMEKNFYLLGFMKSLFLRENCYNCIYATNKRVGDLTIGDFWGINKDDNNGLYKKEEKNGLSLCLVNTTKGKYLFDHIKDNCYFEKREIEEALSGNPQLRFPTIKNKQYDKFRKLYMKNGYFVASKKCLRFEKLKKKVKTLLSKEK